MKRQWTIRRQFREARDGQSRWDRAYQCLLRGGSNAPEACPLGPVSGDQPVQEVHHENSCLCARIDPTSGPNADD